MRKVPSTEPQTESEDESRPPTAAVGYLKLVFMSATQTENYAIISHVAGKTRAWVEEPVRPRQKENATLVALPTDGSFIDVEFAVIGDEQQLRINGKLELVRKRPARFPGYVALGAGGWKVELKRPLAVLPTPAKAAK